MRKRATLTALIASLTLGTALGVLAAPADRLTVTGTVVSSTSTELVINADAGGQQAFVVDRSTTMPGTGLAVGTRVSVRYRPLDDTHSQALEVTVLDPAIPPQPTSLLQPPDPEWPSPLLRDATTRLPFLNLVGLAGLAGSLLLTTRAWRFEF